MKRVERVIELVGGPYDGRQMVLSPGRDGLPMCDLRIPDPVGDPSVYGELIDGWFVEAAPVRMTLYRRDVFAEDRDRWIYRPVRQGPG